MLLYVSERINVSFTPNSLIPSSDEMLTKQPRFYLRIRAGFPSPRVKSFSHYSRVSLPKIFQPPPPFPSSPIYGLSLVELS